MSEAILREDAFFPEEDAGTGKEDSAAFRANQYLSSYSRLHGRIDEKLAFRDDLWQMVHRPGRASSPAERKKEDDIVFLQQMADMGQEIGRDIVHLDNLRREISGVLSRVEHKGTRQILRDLYLSEMPTPQAIRRSHYTKSYFNRLRREGLAEVDRILREEKPMRGYVSPL